MIENVRGTVDTCFNIHPENPLSSISDAWVEKLHSIKRIIDPSLIVLEDDRTNYIMSK